MAQDSKPGSSAWGWWSPVCLCEADASQSEASVSLLHRFLVPALILALPATAAEKRAFHIEDLYRLKGVQHLALSPDGSKLAFEVSSQDLKASTRTTQLWLLEVATGQVKQLTFSGKSDTAPQWSKDGKTLTFLSSRSGGSQLWALDASGGEARKVTSFEAGVGAPKLLPGGGKVVFEASVFPEAMTDSARHKELSDKLDNGPVQAHLAAEHPDHQYSRDEILFISY